MRESPCPACDEVVSADETLERDECPACATPLSELFALAAGRKRTGRRYS